jgi:hypothetical protein
LSIVCATLIGFGVGRIWRTPAAMWTWFLPGVWFAFGFLTLHGDLWSGLFGQRSAGVLVARDVRGFVAFTVPLIRTIFYCFGAWISSTLYSGRFHPLNGIFQRDDWPNISIALLLRLERSASDVKSTEAINLDSIDRRG